MNRVLRGLGDAKDETTAHGFRSSASTILDERAFDSDVIEAALAHQDTNAIRRVYDRASYWPERVKLLQSWAARKIEQFIAYFNRTMAKPFRWTMEAKPFSG